MLKRWHWPVFLYLLTGFCNCSLHSRRTDTAHRAEEKSSTWKTAETVESQQHSVATEKKQGSRQTRRWTPDGKLMEEVIEAWGSDGRVQVSADASSSRQASGVDFSNVRASSSSTKASETKAAWWAHVVYWAIVAIPVSVIAWRVCKWWLRVRGRSRSLPIG